MKTLSERIKAALEKSGVSQADLVRATGSKAASVSNWVGGRTKNLKGENLVRAAQILGVEEAWLASGIGPMQRLGAAQNGEAHDDCLPVRLVDARASAGPGSLVFSSDTKKALMFSGSWLRQHGVRAENDALAFEVDGDSMVDEHITPGAIVLANRTRREPEPNGLFVLWVKHRLYVKKLVREGDQWVARSCNAAKHYPDIPIASEDDRIVGKAFWCGFGL